MCMVYAGLSGELLQKLTSVIRNHSSHPRAGCILGLVASDHGKKLPFSRQKILSRTLCREIILCVVWMTHLTIKKPMVYGLGRK